MDGLCGWRIALVKNDIQRGRAPAGEILRAVSVIAAPSHSATGSLSPLGGVRRESREQNRESFSLGFCETLWTVLSVELSEMGSVNGEPGR